VDDLAKGWLKSDDAAAADHEADPVKWTEAAHYEALARNIWVDNGATLDQAYHDRAVPLVIQQLDLARLRLARLPIRCGWLNSVCLRISI